MAGRLRMLTVVLVVAGAVLAGCGLGAPDRPVPSSPADPSPVAPAPVAPAPAAPPSPAVRCGPRPPGAEQPPDAWVKFDVTEAQLEVINGRLREVLCRQGLWRKGVGFGFNRTSEGTGAFVMIHPGFSGLSARQILDRFLGRGP
jgi:hypothetical protein